MDRRTLLVGGGVGIGLVLAFAVWPRGSPHSLPLGEEEQGFGAFLKIARDGSVTVAVPQSETGQGIWTALPQILADELGAAWETVAVEPAPLAPHYANPLARQLGSFEALPSGGRHLRITAGSTSVRAFERSFREAGAAARALLIAAAADRWGVDPAECEAADGFIRCGARQAGFGELAEDAARRELGADLQLRAEGSGTLAGRPLARLDLPPKSDGSYRFAGDVRLPEMLFASVRIAPHGGRVGDFSMDSLRRSPGVTAVHRSRSWIATVADDWWSAERALAAARVRVHAPERPDLPALRLLLEDALENRAGESLASRGDYRSAIAGSRPISGLYAVAPAPHHGLEPLTATARFADGRLHIWAPTQAPDMARQLAARSAGLEPSDVTLFPLPPGDPGGRAIEPDAIPIAVDLAGRTGRPVQLIVPPSVSQMHDRMAPAALIRLSALPQPDGTLTAWKCQVATADGLAGSLARLAGGAAESRLQEDAFDIVMPPYAIPNVQGEGAFVPMPFLAGYVRGEPQRSLTFATESFVDELARIAGRDPLAFRMAMLGRNPRLARCLSEAAARGGWDGGSAGSALGLAACSAFGSHIGLLAEARIGSDQRVAVDRLVAVVDCGKAINPGLVAQQVEGALIAGLGLAVSPAPELIAGAPLAQRLGSRNLPRLAGSPRIVVHLVRSGDPPGGLSGLGIACVAPAIANAIAAGTGRRLRSLPLNPMGER